MSSDQHQVGRSGTRPPRRPSLAELAGAAACTRPVFDLYLLARLSVQEAADGESLDDQVRQGKRDAATVLGIEEDRITFVEADPDAIRDVVAPVVRVSATYISGAVPWERRSDLREVIDLARVGRVQAVITPNLDRLARNAEVAHRFQRELVNAGVRTLFEGRAAYDLVDDNQLLIYGIRAQFSAFERKLLARRMFGGKIRAVREGFYAGGGLPFGTTLEASNAAGRRRHSRVVGDGARMDTVLTLFENRLQGRGVRELAAWTREIGVMPSGDHLSSPKPGLSQAQISRILSNEFYVTGELTFQVVQPGWPVDVIRQLIPLPRQVGREVFHRVTAMRRRRYGERQPAGSYLLA